MTTIEDVKKALREMGLVVWLLLRNAALVVVCCAIAVCIILGLIYTIKMWPYQTLTVVILALLGVWFLMELTTARAIRLYEEQQEQWRKEKSKPAHAKDFE